MRNDFSHVVARVHVGLVLSNSQVMGHIDPCLPQLTTLSSVDKTYSVMKQNSPIARLESATNQVTMGGDRKKPTSTVPGRLQAQLVRALLGNLGPRRQC